MTFFDCSKSNLNVKKFSGYYNITVAVFVGGRWLWQRKPGRSVTLYNP